MIKLGSAEISKTADGIFVVTFYWHGSFLKGQQLFGNKLAARQFCRERDLSVLWKASCAA